MSHSRSLAVFAVASTACVAQPEHLDPAPGNTELRLAEVDVDADADDGLAAGLRLDCAHSAFDKCQHECNERNRTAQIVEDNCLSSWDSAFCVLARKVLEEASTALVVCVATSRGRATSD